MAQKSPTPSVEIIERLVGNIRSMVNRPIHYRKPRTVAAMVQELADMGVKVTIDGQTVTWAYG